MVHGRDLEPRIVGLVYNVAAAGVMVIKCHCGSRESQNDNLEVASHNGAARRRRK